MPYSATYGKPWLTQRFLLTEPDKVLDVGAGCGTYALLWRPLRRGHWTAIEGYAPNVERFGLERVYDRVYTADVQDFAIDVQVGRDLDLIIFGDVLEHMEFTEAQALLLEAREFSRNVCVSLPIGEHPQGAYGGNEMERHRHSWTLNDLKSLEPTDWHQDNIIATAWWVQGG
jgi:hypothetical protein